MQLLYKKCVLQKIEILLLCNIFLYKKPISPKKLTYNVTKYILTNGINLVDQSNRSVEINLL